jgi:glutamyl endopeptidase
MRPADVPLFLDRLADAGDYAIVGPVDSRRRVLDARRPPFGAICHLERDFGDGRWAGCTGFLISPVMVLTAGHCVYSPIRRAFGAAPTPARIRVTPGRNGRASAPFGTVAADRWWAHRRYVANASRPFDVGLIRLSRPAEGAEPLKLHAPSTPELGRIRQSRLLHISGYPGDKPRGTQWTHAERLDRHTPRDLFYSVDTCPGHSGAPVWIEDWPRGRRTAIGVHTAGPRPHAGGAWGCRPGVPNAPRGQMNRGVRLTPGLLAAVQMVAAGLRSPTFTQVSGAQDNTK